MIFVDTGYLVAIVDRQDQLHQRATAWSAHVRDALITTTAVLLETFNNLSATYLRLVPHSLLDALTVAPGFTVLTLDDALWSRGLKLHRDRHDKNWSLTDCISFIVMADRGIRQSLSHDHHFEQAGFEALLRRDPP